MPRLPYTPHEELRRTSSSRALVDNSSKNTAAPEADFPRSTSYEQPPRLDPDLARTGTKVPVPGQSQGGYQPFLTLGPEIHAVGQPTRGRARQSCHERGTRRYGSEWSSIRLLGGPRKHSKGRPRRGTELYSGPPPTNAVRLSEGRVDRSLLPTYPWGSGLPSSAAKGPSIPPKLWEGSAAREG
jgi:hypothetical protein